MMRVWRYQESVRIKKVKMFKSEIGGERGRDETNERGKRTNERHSERASKKKRVHVYHLNARMSMVDGSHRAMSCRHTAAPRPPSKLAHLGFRHHLDIRQNSQLRLGVCINVNGVDALWEARVRGVVGGGRGNGERGCRGCERVCWPDGCV